MTSDGTNSSGWDAENSVERTICGALNRCTVSGGALALLWDSLLVHSLVFDKNHTIYPGMNNKTEFTYGPGGGRMKIVETVSGSVTSTKQFIGGEERDGSGNVTKQFLAGGLKDGATNYFYSTDHLGSVRAMTDDSGTVQAGYSFDFYGRATKLEGAQDADCQFAGYYLHARSGLNLTATRAYNRLLGQFINRTQLISMMIAMDIHTPAATRSALW